MTLRTRLDLLELKTTSLHYGQTALTAVVCAAVFRNMTWAMLVFLAGAAILFIQYLRTDRQRATLVRVGAVRGAS